ncbi:MAG: pseudouridine synthase [Candidatus Pacebacteria bacterium]|nr:pseudouridine synthase [Candidatus Paceibacterota bacterium]
MRIQKYLSQKGVLSRRETEAFILKGLIKVNGKIVRELGTQIDPEKDKVEVSGAGKQEAAKKITVAIYKPREVVCSKSEFEGTTVFDVFPQFKDLNVVGRLDKDSEGLLLLSNDGVVTSAITGKEHLIEKEYEVFTRETISDGKAKKMEEGIELDGKKTLPAKVKIMDSNKFRIILKEGRKHQIRRMTTAVYLTVVKLKRLRIGNIDSRGLTPGKFRILSPLEVERLKSLAR